LGAMTWGAPVLDWATSWPKSIFARQNEPIILLGIARQCSCSEQLADNPARYS
ncbi:hypothetical protein A2U01_0084951, partial [Trifolium medium]|nr:hypothetical protein [Trifolium medium]